MAEQFKIEVNDPVIGWMHINGAFEYQTFTYFVNMEEAQAAIRHIAEVNAAHGINNKEYRICKRVVSPWEAV